MIRGTKTRLRAVARGDLPHDLRRLNDPETRRSVTMRSPVSTVEEE